MSTTKATFTPAVTETKTIEVAPAKVTLELTPEEAGDIRAFLGRCAGRNFSLYMDLQDLAESGAIPAVRLDDAVPTIKNSHFEPI